MQALESFPALLIRKLWAWLSDGVEHLLAAVASNRALSLSLARFAIKLCHLFHHGSLRIESREQLLWNNETFSRVRQFRANDALFGNFSASANERKRNRRGRQIGKRNCLHSGKAILDQTFLSDY